jgi:hypothetical protein
MNYPIPDSPQEIVALRQKPVDEELVAAAIAGVVKIVRAQGQSLEELTAQANCLPKPGKISPRTLCRIKSLSQASPMSLQH